MSLSMNFIVQSISQSLKVSQETQVQISKEVYSSFLVNIKHWKKNNNYIFIFFLFFTFYLFTFYYLNLSSYSFCLIDSRLKTILQFFQKCWDFGSFSLNKKHLWLVTILTTYDDKHLKNKKYFFYIKISEIMV